MHVKFATLRDKHALEAWIYELEPLHGSKQVCMEKGLNGLGESHEDGRELDELDEQLGESDEDYHKTRRVEEQLGESDEFSLGYVCMCMRCVVRR